MALSARLDVSEFANLNKVARWFIVLRWIAVGGVAAALGVVALAFRHPLPMNVLAALAGSLGLLNAAFHVYFAGIKDGNLSKQELAPFFMIQIGADYLLLLLLVYFTGFLENPLIYSFVFHVLLTAYIFSADVVYACVGVLSAALAIVAAGEYFGLLPHFPLFPGELEAYVASLPLRASGVCLTLAISGYLGASIKRRLEEKAQAVEVELSRYKSLDKVKSNFILQVTHELRGPLAAINGYHEMISRGITGETSPKTQETVAKAERRTENLLTMIDEMIDYAYMRTDDATRFAPSRVSLREVIEAVVDALEAQAAARGIGFELKCAADVTVEANRDLVKIIASNLLSNAVKYSRPKSSVSVAVVREPSEVCLEVRDHGIGIAPAELPNIFEEFYRTRRAREIERDGTGLGLAITKKAVEALGGRISVVSEIDKGTAFHVYFPAGGRNGEQDTHN